MEERSFDERDSVRVKVAEEKPLEEKPPKKAKPVKKVVPKTVQIVLARNKRVTTIGSVTGDVYVFPNAGAILDVDERDAPSLLAKGAGKNSCCSGQPASPYFRLI